MALIQENKEIKQQHKKQLLTEPKETGTAERITIYLDKSVHRQLQLIKIDTKISVSKLIEQAVQEKYNI